MGFPSLAYNGIDVKFFINRKQFAEGFSTARINLLQPSQAPRQNGSHCKKRTGNHNVLDNYILKSKLFALNNTGITEEEHNSTCACVCVCVCVSMRECVCVSVCVCVCVCVCVVCVSVRTRVHIQTCEPASVNICMCEAQDTSFLKISFHATHNTSKCWCQSYCLI